MSGNLITKDQLIEPYTIISEFEVKQIGKLENYVKTMTEEVTRLNGLEFDQDFKKLMDFGKAISNDMRLKILYFIKRVEKTCFCELENVFDLKQSTLNYHIGLLKRANLVETYKEGKLIIIQLNDEFGRLQEMPLFDLFGDHRA